MICISVTPISRKLAPADILNASRKCDLIELCLDHFKKKPEVGELLKLTDKPILVSCRSQRDGGQFVGSEEDRMQLLRNAIVAEPAYVELDLDIADKVPRFGKTKRVISYTSLNRPLGKIDEIFEKCWKAKADVVKVTWPTEDLDQAWPLLAAVTQSRELPVVGQGIGKSGLTFSLLGRKYGSPWIYAALERGMEAYNSQPTVWQLEDEYHWQEISKGTRFVGVIGMGAAENTTVQILNAAFRKMEKRIRCLPLIPGKLDRLQKRLAMMKINGLLVDPLHGSSLTEMCAPGDDIVQQSGFLDVAMARTSGWQGRSTLFQAIHEVATEVRDENWARNRASIIFGAGPLAQGTAAFLKSQNGAISVAGPSDNTAVAAAKEADARHIPWSAIHATAADVIILTSGEIECGVGRGQLNPSLIREGLTVVDLTRYPLESPFAEESRARGAHYISPQAVFMKQLQIQFKMLTGNELPESAIQEGLAGA